MATKFWLGCLVSLCALPAAAAEQILPVIRILLPETGVTYGKILPIQIEVENFQLTDRWSIPGGEARPAVPGAGHLHYTLDNRMLAATSATSLIIEDLGTAEHVLVVTLANHDHTLLPIEQRVIFNVVAPRKGLSRPPVVGTAQDH